MNDSIDLRKNMDKNAQELKEDCLHTSKNNFLYASTMNKWRYTLGIVSSLAAGVIVLSVSGVNGPVNLIISVCSVIALLSSTVTTTWNPGKNSEMHQRIGNEYLALQKRVQKFIDIDVRDETLSNSDLKARLDKLSEEQVILYKAYSHVVLPEWVHKKVIKKLASGEAIYDFENKKST